MIKLLLYCQLVFITLPILVSSSSFETLKLDEKNCITVGVGKQYLTITEACNHAPSGTIIKVFALPNNQPYKNEQINVFCSNLSIVAVPSENDNHIKIDGGGFDYSGIGKIPRAIFQFNDRADNCSLIGFELYNAHNQSQNGAGVRINKANNIRIENCVIHDCDMGIMSNGSLGEAKNQMIIDCEIYSNGNENQPGMNHNLYLGGHNVTIRKCKIYKSLTGHNVKSRAHYIEIRDSQIYHSANRELDLVDAEPNTTVEHSDALILNCFISKAKDMTGNRNVIHFGQDNGNIHNGKLFLINNTIETDYTSPILVLSSAQATAELIGNTIISSNPTPRELFIPYPANNFQSITGKNNRFIPSSILIKDSPYQKLSD